GLCLLHSTSPLMSLAATDFAATISVGVTPMPPTATKSLKGSYGSLEKLCTNDAITVALISTVQPSGGAVTTATVPMLPVAPPRFSTKKVLPMDAVSFSATTRLATSVAPPAG